MSTKKTRKTESKNSISPIVKSPIQKPPAWPKPIAVTNAKQAQRLLSRLISQLQMHQINNQDAKDICYLLSTYIQIHTAVSFEKRLDNLEQKRNEASETEQTESEESNVD